MKRATRILAALLCVLLLLPTVVFAEAQPSLEKQIAQSAEGMSALGGKKGELLKDRELFPAGDSVCDWLAIAMALSGTRESYSDYLAELKTHAEDAYAKNGRLDRNKATEYHRIALTVLALGGDPTHFGTKPDGSAIDLIAEGTYNYAGDPGAQGLNGWIWALLALDAEDTEVPDDARYSREDMVNAIAVAQEPDGGFGLIPGKSDVDITAMAVQALAPYRNQLETEIDAALTYLSGQLTDTCGYIAYGDENAESTAQVILALCALGIDPETDEPVEKAVEWQEQAYRLAAELGRQMVEQAGTAAFIGHRIPDKKNREKSYLYTAPKAYNSFLYDLRKLYPKQDEGGTE